MTVLVIMLVLVVVRVLMPVVMVVLMVMVVIVCVLPFHWCFLSVVSSESRVVCQSSELGRRAMADSGHATTHRPQA
jgi:hypothetical protein